MNRNATGHRRRPGPAGSRPKQPSGGDRKKERKARGYALLNEPRMLILAVAKERKELREKLSEFRTVEGNVEVALWPLGVEMPAPEGPGSVVQDLREATLEGLKDIAARGRHSAGCLISDVPEFSCNCYLSVVKEALEKLGARP